MMLTLIIIRDITLNTVKSLRDRSDLARKEAGAPSEAKLQSH